MQNKIQRFPRDFWWGAATSAHQVEGGTHNQWTVWELENAASLAKQSEHKLDHLAVWDEVRNQATNPENYVSGRATDHYNLYEQDFDIVKSLNLNIFRFSIEWSRIEPQEGAWDPAEIEHYRKYIAALRARGVEPFVTLFHWTLPVWFAEKGGFARASNIKYFVRFAEKVLEELGTELKYITTINEPDTVVTHGYITQDHPPQERSPLKALWVYRNLLVAHRRVYKMAKRRSRRYLVGFTKSYAYVQPADDNWLSRLSARADYALRDDAVLGYVGRRTDFVGVNYYFSDKRQGAALVDDDGLRNDLGWTIHPDKLEFVLRRLSERHGNVPIIVTESGVADMHDRYRRRWIAASLAAISRAMAAGANVRGYLHWSLLDNFEWSYGRWPRFGLVEVNYETMRRKPRASARWYGDVVAKMRGINE